MREREKREIEKGEREARERGEMSVR